jgi:hypothetical protein
MVYFHDPAVIKQRAHASLKALRLPFSTPSQLRWNGEPEPVGPFAGASDGAMRSSLVALLRKEFKPADARCVISLQNYWQNDPEQQELWAPFLSMALVWPLSLDVRIKYWDRFMARVNSSAPSKKCSERWLAYNDQSLESERYLAFHDLTLEDSQWKLRYLQKTMRIEREINSGGWHLVKLSSPILTAQAPRP